LEDEKPTKKEKMEQLPTSMVAHVVERTQEGAGNEGETLLKTPLN